ncbi:MULTISPECIES: DUF523 domain-containing protein [unclassified Endozoicomonas]|uniref:DUF523 domain-containing protein n=1 Tax=unclassified Endozoicomonas TaxID=2644528 RepID=UPI002147BF22|nr:MULTISPECIES: DUF523 domain-containing protein [unclassified Endozoicomonas]
MKQVLVSACLLGDRVRYDGNSLSTNSEILQEWIDDGRVVSICPEVSAGMSIPRAPAEISGGEGNDVISGRISVIENSGEDVTEKFLTGANNALSLCKQNHIKVAVLADFSPSCGSSSIYNGAFSGTKIDGAGVTAALLTANGIKVFSQYQLEEANKAMHPTSGSCHAFCRGQKA